MCCSSFWFCSRFFDETSLHTHTFHDTLTALCILVMVLLVVCVVAVGLVAVVLALLAPVFVLKGLLEALDAAVCADPATVLLVTLVGDLLALVAGVIVLNV